MYTENAIEFYIFLCNLIVLNKYIDNNIIAAIIQNNILIHNTSKLPIKYIKAKANNLHIVKGHSLITIYSDFISSYQSIS